MKHATRDSNGSAAVTVRRAVRLRPDIWARFKRRYIERGISPATRLGQLIEHDLGIGVEDGAHTPLSELERQLIWNALALRARTMPLRPNAGQTMYQVHAEYQDTLALRDRFASAFDPPKPTVRRPRVPAGA